MADTREPIPAGVYFDCYYRNFYDAGKAGEGMGIEFFDKWRGRADEFPHGPNAVMTAQARGVRIAALEAELASAQADLALITAALPDLSYVIIWLRNGCEPDKAADELQLYENKITAGRARLVRFEAKEAA